MHFAKFFGWKTTIFGNRARSCVLRESFIRPRNRTFGRCGPVAPVQTGPVAPQNRGRDLSALVTRAVFSSLREISPTFARSRKAGRSNDPLLGNVAGHRLVREFKSSWKVIFIVQLLDLRRDYNDFQATRYLNSSVFRTGDWLRLSESKVKTNCSFFG